MNKLIIILLLFLPYLCQAQKELQYGLDGETIEFFFSKEEFLSKYNEKDASFINEISNTKSIKVLNNYSIIKVSPLKGNLSENISEIKRKYNNKLIAVEPIIFTNSQDGKLSCIGELILKVKDKNQIPILLHGYSYQISEDEYIKNQFLIKFNKIDTQELFKITNRLEINKGVEFVQPNFLHFIKLSTDDPLFNEQWAIKNTGDNTPNSLGLLDSDMDVDEAWVYSTGKGIKVAVFDTGVDLNHNDLVQNLLPGFDATTSNTNGGYLSGENKYWHGTSVAGIIGATANNNIGIAGVAYNSKILPVKMIIGSVGSVTTSNRMQRSLNWAMANGADIINCSWTSHPDNLLSSTIEDAVNNGRNGKGCVILFGAGNDNESIVAYPARLDAVIAVGASNMCDERVSVGVSACYNSSWGSHYGDDIDVVAPGFWIWSTGVSGENGTVVPDYRKVFGTSFATPNAAGVVALILSINPDLTSSEARKILERSTDKITGGTNNYVYNETQPNSQNYHPNGTWNNEVGYGRVNALNAVESMYEIGGDAVVCGDEAIYDLFAIPDRAPFSWRVSDDLVLNNDPRFSDNQSITVNSTNSLRGAAFVEVDYNGQTLRKDMWWGEPQVEVKVDPVGGNYVWLELVGANGSDITKQGIRSITWTEVPGTNNGGCFASFQSFTGTLGKGEFHALAHG